MSRFVSTLVIAALAVFFTSCRRADSDLIGAGVAASPAERLSALLGDRDAEVRLRAAVALSQLGTNAVPALIDSLKDERTEVAQSAIKILGRIGPEARTAAPALVEALESDFGEAAVATLDQIGPEAILDLASALKCKQARVRALAAAALERHGAAAAPADAALIAALDDSAWETRCAAARALGRPDAPPDGRDLRLVALLNDEFHEVRGAAAQALAAFPHAPFIVEALTAKLHDPNGTVRELVIKSLGRHASKSDAAIDALISALPKPETRDESIKALESVGHRAARAVPALIATSRDPSLNATSLGFASSALPPRSALRVIDPSGAAVVALFIEDLKHPGGDVRMYAAEALSKAPSIKLNAAAISALMDAARNYNDRFRVAAIHALTTQGADCRSLIPPLREELKKATHQTMEYVAPALGALGEAAEPAIPELIDKLRDEFVFVHRPAADALREIGRPAERPLAELVSRPGKVELRSRALGILLEGRPDCELIPEVLMAAWADGDPVLLAMALAAAPRYRHASARLVPSLIAAMKRSTRDTACLIASALAEQDAPTAVAQLSQLLADGDPATRSNAALALSIFGESARSATEALVGLCGDSDPVARREAVRALAALGAGPDRAIPELVARLADREVAVRREAARGLASWGPGAAAGAPALLRVLDEEAIRPLALAALAAIGSPVSGTIPKLVVLAGDPDASTRSAAIGCLGRMGPKGRTALVGLIESGSIAARRDVVRELAAGDAGTEATATSSALVRSLGQNDSILQNAAISAISAIGAPAVPELVAIVKSKADPRRINAVRALAAIGPSASVDEGATVALLDLTKGDESELRREAVVALGAILRAGGRRPTP